MSYNNFKATVWSKAVDRDLKRICVYAADSNTKYQGEIKGVGDTVRVLGVGKPKITMFENGQKIELDDAQEVENTSVAIKADKVATFNYGVGDIDKAQGAGGVLPILNTEASEECANVIDKELAKLSLDVSVKTETPAKVTDANVLELLDTALQHLYEMDVNPSGLITATMSPAFYTRFRRAYAKLDTNNSEAMKNGKVGMYANLTIRLSNNVAKDSKGNDLIQIKTPRALALVKSAPHVEPYRVEKGFMDAVKGFTIFGTKVVRPKEIVNIAANY